MSVNYSSPRGNDSKNKTDVFQRRKPTRDELVREYDTQNSERARNARLKAQEATLDYRNYKRRKRDRASRIETFDAIKKEKEELLAKKREIERERETAEAHYDAGRRAQKTLNEATYKTSDVLSSKEYQNKTRQNYEHYERERALRDPYSLKKDNSSDRIVIDARGTIDSRAFNEKSTITNIAIDERDTHAPSATTSQSESRWMSKKETYNSSKTNTGSLNGTFENFNARVAKNYKSLPPFVKIALPIIAFLIIVLIILLIRG